MLCVRSFSSSFCVQSQLQQAHGSVPFSCRQLRRKWASFTLSRPKYSSQYGRSSDSGGSQKQVSTHCATPFSVTLPVPCFSSIRRRPLNPVQVRAHQSPERERDPFQVSIGPLRDN